MKLSMTWKPVLLAVLGGTFALYGQGAAPPPPAPKPASDRTCPPNARRMTFALKDSGEIVNGPVCVAVRLNGLRYSSELGRTVTYSAGKDLAAAIAAAPAAGGERVAAPGPARDIGSVIQDIVERLSALSGLWNSFQARNEKATATVNTAVNGLRSLVNQSDDLYRSNEAAGVLQAAKDSNLRTAVENAFRAEWAASDNIQVALKGLQVDVSRLLLSNPSDADKATLTAIQANITAVLTDLAPSLINGDKTAAFNKQKAIVDFWNRIIVGLTADSFEKSTYVTCGVTVNQNKQIAVKLYTADRLPSFDSQPVTLSDAKDPFVTVNCPSPFVVSAGVEMRFLNTATYGLVPSGPSGTNLFGVTSNQNNIPLPIAIAHVRLAENDGNRYGLFASFGVAAHTQGSGTSGSAAEYLTGLSLGLFRTMFITAGLHLGTVSALNGGYKVGDAVPTGVTTAPVTGSYKAGFGLAITFTKP